MMIIYMHDGSTLECYEIAFEDGCIIADDYRTVPTCDVSRIILSY